MKYQIIPVTALQQNCTLLWCNETQEAALVDPGGDSHILLKAIAEHGVKLGKILLTHGHFDHVGAAMELAHHFNVPILGPHKDDRFWLEMLPEQGNMFGGASYAAFLPDSWLNEGDTVQIGKVALQVLHCPGHTPGHIVFVNQLAKLALVGDVLFKGSVGRSDFPRGSHQQLLNSIRQKLFPLGDDYAVIPGHGPMSTIGEERLTNPFVGVGA